jgi:ABC-2 type transport system permease protein
MENILGKHYKWFYIVYYSFKKALAYRANSLIWIFSKFLKLLFIILFWYWNIQSGSTLFDFRTIFTYYVIGTLFSWSNGMNWNIGQQIIKGTISTTLIRPLPFLRQSFAQDFGWWLFTNLIETILMIVLIIFGREYLIFTGILNFVLYLFVSIIGYFILSLLGIIIGTVAFYITEINGVMSLQSDLKYYLSGQAIPLNIVSALNFTLFLPFSYTFFHPLQFYFGNYSFNQGMFVILGGIFWLIFLAIVAKLLFMNGLKRNESVGL